MTVNDTERRGAKGGERERERKRKEGEFELKVKKIYKGGGDPHHQQLPPKLKTMVIKSYVAIREVEYPREA